MRFFDGAAVDGALAYPGLVDILQAAFRQGAIAPLRHHHAIALDGRPEATLLLMPAWEASAPGCRNGWALPGRQDGHRVPRQRRARQARRVRHLSAAVGRDRRDAGRDGRDAAHRLAHGCGVGLGQPLPVPPRCLAPAHGGRRRAGAAPRRRARLGAADPRGRALEPLAGAGPRARSPLWRHGPRRQRRRRPGGRRAPRRHRLGGDHLRRAADPRRLARARHARRLRRRLPAHHARDRRRRRAPRPHLRRHAHRRLRRGRRHRAAAGTPA